MITPHPTKPRSVRAPATQVPCEEISFILSAFSINFAKMSCTAEELVSAMSEFTGGSSRRYLIRQYPEFQFSEGVHRVIELTHGDWLLRLCATSLAPAYARAWLEGKASIGQISVEVVESTEQRHSAIVRLILEDDVPAELVETVPVVQFPVGHWHFYFGTDPREPEGYITTMIIPEEY